MFRLGLIALALLAPTALSMPPFIEAWDGNAQVRLYVASGMTVCHDAGDARLTVEREMEAATFVLAVAGACVPALVLRGTLTGDGWEFHDDTGLASGSFTQTSMPGVWRLVALVDTCPPFAICEFAHGVRAEGDFWGPTIVF